VTTHKAWFCALGELLAATEAAEIAAYLAAVGAGIYAAHQYRLVRATGRGDGSPVRAQVHTLLKKPLVAWSLRLPMRDTLTR